MDIIIETKKICHFFIRMNKLLSELTCYITILQAIIPTECSKPTATYLELIISLRDS